ncbi:CHASE2 domain-containing protein [bacterium]|nr:CHASE2 domain-containing protein [bacterium]
MIQKQSRKGNEILRLSIANFFFFLPPKSFQQMFFNKKTDSGKWVLLIPIFVCSLAVFPGINQIFIALENKLFDSFFHFYPPHAGYSPAVVIAKDQSTLDFLGREPDRKDLSQILRRLASSGVKVAAIDFIYDSPKSPETDLELASALDLFPGMVIAERFKPRTAISNGMETIQIIDENAQRPPWPLPLYEPIASRAKERGLVNIFRDQDGVIRILPLAFFPDEMTEFRPGLAFSAWLSSLLAIMKDKILRKPQSLG